MKTCDLDVEKVEIVFNAKTRKIYLNYDGGPIYLQPPEMDLPFDTGDFIPNDSHPGSGKYTVKAQLKGNKEEGSPMKEFYEKMMALDNKIKHAAQENSVAWFKKKTMSMDMVESIYTPMVKHSMDQETGEVSDQYPPGFGFKIAKYDGNINCMIYDENKDKINITNPDGENFKEIGIIRPFDERMSIPHEGLFKKGTKVKTVLQCGGVWIFGGRFGCGWTAKQILIKPLPGFDNYAFLDDSDEEQGESLGEKCVLSDSDESDGSDGSDALSRQVSHKA